MVKELEGIKVTYPDEMEDAEAILYVHHGLAKFGKHLKGMEIQIAQDDEKDAILNYDVDHMPFQRLRRITGYLVGNMTRWNDAKRAEERDRVKHGVE